jgi:hypothetical protein
VARENANGARAKSGGRTVPVGPDLIWLYADYLHEEYGSIDSDYVFVSIWAGPKGQAWPYQAAYDLVVRVRARTGIAFDPHWFRHSAATRWLRDGVPIGIRGGQLIPRPSFFQLDNTRKARARGEPWHLIVHEDVLIFRAPGKSSSSAERKPARQHGGVQAGPPVRGASQGAAA